MNYRNDIQILRALAVMLVVLFHLEIAGFKSGFLGVDIFFVISGFLMAVLYKKGEAKSFYLRRVKRLMPAYFVTVIATLLVSLFVVLPPELAQVEEQAIYSLFFTSNIGFWLQNSYFSKIDFNPLLHLWSLGVEMQFYIIVPIIFWIFRKSKISFLLVFLTSMLLCFAMLKISPKTSFYMMPLRAWEFLIGYYVAVKLTSEGNVKYFGKTWLGVIALFVLALIPFFKIDGNSHSFILGHPGLFALLVCILTATVLVYGLPQKFSSSYIGKQLTNIGTYSYSIYLVHFPLLVLYLYQPFSGTILHPNNLIDKILLLIGIAIFSILLHNFIEIKKYKAISRVYVAALVTVLLLVVAARILPNYLYSLQEQNIFNAVKDRSEYRCGRFTNIINRDLVSCKLNPGKFDNSVFLVGNSHADAIKTEFNKTASQHQYNTFFLASNTPLMDNSVTPEILIKEAEKYHIKHIVMDYAYKTIDSKKIIQTAELAKNNGIKVSYILPLPVYKEPVPKIVWQNKESDQDIKAEYLAKNAEFVRELSDYSTKNSLFKLYDVSNIMCPNKCLIADKELHPYYFDTNHLTLTGSKQLIPMFEQILTD